MGEEEEVPVVEPTTESTSINPAWNDLLGKLPEGLHTVVTPVLKEWDTNFQTEQEKLRTRYAAFDPYVGKEEDVQYGMNLLAKLAEDPKFVYDQLAAHYKFNEKESEKEVEELDLSEVETEETPAFKQLKAEQDRIKQMLQEQEDSKTQAEANKWVESKIATLNKQHLGVELDWDFILAKAQGAPEGSDYDKVVDQVAQQYVDMVAKIRNTPSKSAQAPQVLTGNGVVGRTAVTGPMNTDTRVKLGVEMLQALQSKG
jgi:hypothetical protein